MSKSKEGFCEANAWGIENFSVGECGSNGRGSGY